jgi:ribosomal-protein-alanine N-acetyltransferase
VAKTVVLSWLRSLLVNRGTSLQLPVNAPAARDESAGRSVITIELLSSDADLDAVLDIEANSFTSPWTRDMYVAELQNVGVSFCFVARSTAGRVVGYCSCWRVVDELHINNLAVSPTSRRKGVAKALLTHVLQEGVRLGARRATLEVRRSNDAARQLYSQLGFAPAGVRRAYYTNPVEDALVLWRESRVET